MVDGVLVSREALRKALVRLGKFAKPRAGERAFLFTENGMLRIRTPRLEVSVGAEGDLLVVASVEASMLISLHRVLPKPNPLLFQVVGNSLHIDTFSMTCDILKDAAPFTRQETAKPPPRESSASDSSDPLAAFRNPSPRLFLKLRQERSATDLMERGYAGAVQEALLERDQCITKALKALERFDVKREDLVKLIDECVMRD